MYKYKIVFLCHFSSSNIRSRLELKSYRTRNALCKLRGVPLFGYDDFAVWVTDYIQQFEKQDEFEIHIVAPHRGMKKKYQSFEINGIYYHFFKCDCNYVVDMIKTHLHIYEYQNYKENRRRIHRIISEVQPNLILLCGAENPYYSSGVLDVEDRPIYVILQTLLNDPKRIEMGVGTPYRRLIEAKIFQKANYFCTVDDKAMTKIKEFNKEAVMMPVAFPTHRPEVEAPKKKEYDYVFFARNVTKNKGIEDLIKAIAIVKEVHKGTLLNVIGGINVEYKRMLDKIIEQLGLQNNIVFSGYYENIEETYANVAKAKAVVVPGITAGLNSTVREAMFMAMPTICYETKATTEINAKKKCLLTASMGDINELAHKMLIIADEPLYAQQVAINGKDYAENNFGNEAIVKLLLYNCCQIIEGRV